MSTQEGPLLPRHSRNTLYELKCTNNEHRYPHLPEISATATIIHPPALFCTGIIAVGSTIAQQTYNAQCHTHAMLKCVVSSTDFHTTNVVDVNWTVTMMNQLQLPSKVVDDTAYSSTTASLWMWTPQWMDTNFRQ